MPSPRPIQRLVSSRDVCDRYSLKAPRSLRRWVIAGVFPPPDRIIRGRNYWWEQTLIEHERQLVVGKFTAETTSAI
jgi:hypothetical protein